jgi:putative transposase
VPGLPHYVTQRGDRREPEFFEADDYRLYRRLVAAGGATRRAAVRAYCLMPNHVHLPIMPAWRDADGLRATLPKRNGATPGRSTRGSGGPAICSRAALARW